MNRADDMNMEANDAEEQEIQEDEPLIENTEDPPVDPAAAKAPEPDLPNLCLGPEHNIFTCNHCKDYVRGGVITICGHLYCWVCLWPHLADQQSPECPACKTALLLHEDILPFYGEGPNAGPGDQEALAEPGGVPRPTGICLQPPDEDRIIMAEQDMDPFEGGDYPWIAFIYKCLQWVQWVCIVIFAVVWWFRSGQVYGSTNAFP